MTRHASRRTGRFSTSCLSLIGCLALLLLACFCVQATSFDAPTPSAGSVFSPLKLSQLDAQYPLESLKHSPGFIPAPTGQRLENAPERSPDAHPFGLTPDFRQHHRYWLYTRVTNLTENDQWMLHISNFGNVQPRVLIRGPHSQEYRTFDEQGRTKDTTSTNTTGRAIPLTLSPGESYQIIIELEAGFVAIQPYIGLMSLGHYKLWTAQMDYAFKLAIGIALGLALVGLTCWLLTLGNVFLWAALSSLLLLVYYLWHSGAPALFWPSNHERTNIYWILLASTLITQLLFAAGFLRIKRTSAGWYPFFVGAGVITLLMCVANMFVSARTNVILISVNYAVVWIVIIASGIAKVRTEGRYYIIYLLGWIVPMLSVAHVLLSIHSSQQPTEEIGPSYRSILVLYGLVLHMFLHTIALILRIKKMGEEKLKTEFISQAKSRFIAQSSHDLNQPLHSMSLFLDHLKPHVQGLDGQKIFVRLKNTHRQMRDSFKAIMDLSKLEAGGIQPQFKPIHLADLFSRLQHEYGVHAAEKGLRLTFHDCSLTAFSDPLLLERMLRNLISNAIKYTASGRVVVGCRRRGSRIDIQVLDTGSGIELAAHEHIFDIYQRSATVSEQSEGSGIGLSIVRHISELLDHPVTIRSEPGRGSCFTISIPRLTERSPRQTTTTFPEDNPIVALVFQDRTLQDALSERFRKWHCPVQTFGSIEAAQSANPAPSVLLCDPPRLSEAALSQEALRQFAQGTVAACTSKPDTALPGAWIALTPVIRPSQLRALLNIAVRRRQARLTGAAPDAPLFDYAKESLQPE
ncbi:hypothetical protein EB809_15335 [Marinobacter sp. R17]|uniref:ATP-binding protein n=1 Tax=Marinobacter sp. R17 TaxID=2484250 RepID=UPI000F4D2025|nr:ATP-binding protein [Marinobacter sp. R17]ROT98200.1 hypothetical protein EB809_15335 [Marinobacter sp. R17]